MCYLMMPLLWAYSAMKFQSFWEAALSASSFSPSPLPFSPPFLSHLNCLKLTWGSPAGVRLAPPHVLINARRTLTKPPTSQSLRDHEVTGLAGSWRPRQKLSPGNSRRSAFAWTSNSYHPPVPHITSYSKVMWGKDRGWTGKGWFSSPWNCNSRAW